jgi:ribosomal protein S18 acetylase RimI-like enzyme
MEFTLGPATAADARELSALARAAKAHWGYPETWLLQWSGQFEITPELIAKCWTRVARAEGRALGFAVVDDDQSELVHLWVLPQAQRRGIGQRLLAAAVDAARRRGLAALRIESDPNAAAFYESCGARKVSERAAPMPGALERVLPLLVIDVAGAPAR